ncbi:crinkler (CRN) family protein, putative [Rhizophagus irregularis DAOM 181602=DAOM 197198]|nr:crinkler (CRN) family protein, putative [Rhizophagus irregularis DAOM 181602=DAOM 197198]
MPGLTSSNTESENLITDISQEISRLALNLDEEALPETERTRLRAFFTSILNNAKIKVVSNVLNTIPKDNCTERLAYLKKVSTELRSKINIADAFPQGLLYLKPEPLLRTSGANWEYQPDPTLKEILQKTIREHFDAFLKGDFDKTNIPIYLFLSGAGTGKSRNANEFQQTAISSVSKDKDLLARIKDAYVFNVSYENGTALRPREDPFLAIGTRMLFQLLREEMDFDEVRLTYEPPSPMSVLSLVAKYRNRDLKDITVILIVDAMQQLMLSTDDGLNKDSDFYRTMSSIGDLGLKKIFLLPCITCTIATSVEKALQFSHRKRAYLPVPSMKPPTYRQGNKGSRSSELTDRYVEALQNTGRDARAIARAVLTRTLLDVDKPVPRTEKNPDEYIHSGLIRFERKHEAQTGYFTAPYIWLWMLVEKSHEWGDSILRDWAFSDYKELREFMSSPGSKPWQGFERFVATFRCLKSTILDENEPTTISEVHAGALLNGDLQFINHHLQLEYAKHRTDTRSEKISTRSWNVECNKSIVNVRQFKHCIINSPGAKAGDAFISLDLPDDKSLNEIQQYKHTQNSINQQLYAKERTKSSSYDDFFILFTTSANCDVKLPRRSGIVYEKNFKEYFGPFAGRAFRQSRVRTPIPSAAPTLEVNINTDPIEQLCKVNQIGEKRANVIFSKRPFKDINDAFEKTSISKKVLKNFYFPNFPNGRTLHTISHILPRIK